MSQPMRPPLQRHPNSNFPPNVAAPPNSNFPPAVRGTGLTGPTTMQNHSGQNQFGAGGPMRSPSNSLNGASSGLKNVGPASALAGPQQYSSATQPTSYGPAQTNNAHFRPTGPSSASGPSGHMFAGPPKPVPGPPATNFGPPSNNFGPPTNFGPPGPSNNYGPSGPSSFGSFGPARSPTGPQTSLGPTSSLGGGAAPNGQSGPPMRPGPPISGGPANPTNSLGPLGQHTSLGPQRPPGPHASLGPPGPPTGLGHPSAPPSVGSVGPTPNGPSGGPPLRPGPPISGGGPANPTNSLGPSGPPSSQFPPPVTTTTTSGPFGGGPPSGPPGPQNQFVPPVSSSFGLSAPGPPRQPPPPTGSYPYQPPVTISSGTVYGPSMSGPPSSLSGPSGGLRPSRPLQSYPGMQQQDTNHIQESYSDSQSRLNLGGAPAQALANRLGSLSLNQGMEPVDLLQNRHILPSNPLSPPKPKLQAELWNNLNCSADVFRSTLTKVPETDALLKKCRLPLGILIHPFKDLSHLPVIQCATIVRCRQCRTYINPFVHFVDQRRWRCNVCYRVNELPEEFLYDPVSKSYGDPSRRPECKSATIEFIAPSEYMLRPPQPAVYIFCLDVSRSSVETGYVKVFCDTLIEELEKLPGDSRTQIGFITYDRNVHFYSLPEGATQPTQLTVCDIDDMFLPSPSDLLVNLNENRGLVHQLLEELPSMFADSNETHSALGAALQASFKMASPTGGRVTVFQHTLPTVGPGALSQRQGGQDKKDVLGPATDFYKKLALDCSGQQIAVDMWTLGGSYVDLATLSGISKFSGGQVQHFPGYHVEHNPCAAAAFEGALRRYFTRKIGFEAVMRIRCTRGLTLHTFHGNFFVRSTDLLSLPNINPDAGFGMLVSIEDDLRDSKEVTFQAALLYTSSKGERRIRVHTLCLPTSASVSDIINGADQQAVLGMLTKFAADRAVNDSVSDAKEGLVVSCVDTIETYRTQASMSIPSGLLISQSLRLLPLYVLACLRSAGFRNGVRADDRSFCFSQFKTLPLTQLIQTVYPDLYRVDNLTDEGALKEEDDNGTEVVIPQPDRLQLSFEKISATGMYLMDCGDIIYLYLCRGLHAMIIEHIFGTTRLLDVDERLTDLPEKDNDESERLRTFVHWLNGAKPYSAPIRIIREDSKSRHLFLERMVEDRFDGSFSYFEFLQHLKQQVK